MWAARYLNNNALGKNNRAMNFYRTTHFPNYQGSDPQNMEANLVPI